MNRKLAFIAPLALALGACSQVDTGHRGVFVEWGEPTEQVSEGFYWYNPVSTDLVQMNVQQRKITDTTEAYTEDVQQATIKYSLTFNLNPDAAMNMYSDVGQDWAGVLIPQVVEQAIKDVFGQSEAVADTINNRPVVVAAIRQQLERELAGRNITVRGFEIRDISFSNAFENAVEEKQIAVENAQAAVNRTVQVEEEARQRVIAAESEAEAMRIQTNALANSPRLIEWERAQAQREAVRKWNGQLPSQMIPGQTVPFLNLQD